MKKRLLAALLTSALALSLTACGGGNDSSATDGGDTASTHDGPYKISMVLKTNAAEFWNIVQAGAEAYEDEHPDQVSLDIKGPPAETYYEEQLNTIPVSYTHLTMWIASNAQAFTQEPRPMQPKEHAFGPLATRIAALQSCRPS